MVEIGPQRPRQMVALRSFDGLAGIAPRGGAGTAATPAPPNKCPAVRRGRRRPARVPIRHGNHTVGWLATSSCGDGVLQSVAVILAAVPTPFCPAVPDIAGFALPSILPLSETVERVCVVAKTTVTLLTCDQCEAETGEEIEAKESVGFGYDGYSSSLDLCPLTPTVFTPRSKP